MSFRSRGPCIGILRESKTKWERRSPLTPEHVGRLVEKGIRVIVQPSPRRVFHDSEFARRGAEISEDLGPANTILGVKEIPPEKIIPEKAYVLFSHVIKAQPANMPFLDACMEKNVTLFDYERILSDGPQRKRLVAFGKYAGIAGMVDSLRGLGERLLSLGYSTPFLGISNSFMYPSIQSAKLAVEELGREIQKVGTPLEFGSPFTFLFTGSGNVTEGALEIFKILPHTFVDPFDLKRIGRNDVSGNSLIGSIATAKHLVHRSSDQGFDKQEYYSHPEMYEPIFHKNIAPHINVLVNGMYWDYRFPRLLTKKQMFDLHRQEQSENSRRLIQVADISCDINGSIEFNEKPSTIDNPFYYYDPETKSVHHDVDGQGVMLMTIDNLPSEFPRDASEHFSHCLFPFVEGLANFQPHLPFSSQVSTLKRITLFFSCNLDLSFSFFLNFSAEMRNSCIVADKQLTPDHKYIQQLRFQNERISSDKILKEKPFVFSKAIRIDGHLFDSGLINQVLDAVELSGNHFKLLHLSVSPNAEHSQRTSSAVIQLSSRSKDEQESLVSQLETLCQVSPKAHAVFSELPFAAIHDEKRVSSAPAPRVVVLGSGMVARPTLKYLDANRIPSIVASNHLDSLNRITKSCANGYVHPQVVDVRKQSELESLINDSEIKVVISLLPASFHFEVAKICLRFGKHLVTSSYITPEMENLSHAAREKNLTFLNEMGLDPGMDHMSASKVINEFSKNDGITSFQSYCGGLPAPEAASDNPLRYKFSWSPAGVISAMQKPAKFIRDGHLVEIEGHDLLSSASPFNGIPVMNLEHLPNRDSIPYASSYGLELKQLRHMYRATLRYSGFCQVMYNLRKIGMLSMAPVDPGSHWVEIIAKLLKCRSNFESISVSLEPFQNFESTLECLKWLGLLDENQSPLQTTHGPTIADAFTSLLLQKLKLKENEKDMVVLHHEFGLGNSDSLLSTLVCYGDPKGDSAMARCVGLPAAIAAKLILEGEFNIRGVLRPVFPEIYIPALAELSEHGLSFSERIESRKS